MASPTEPIRGIADSVEWAKPANPEGYIEPYQSTLVGALQDKPIPERPWLVPSWIPDRQVTMLAGDGGVGKTLLAQMLLTATAMGRDWLGLPTSPRKVFGLFLEDDEDELHRRQEAINRSLDIGFADLEDRMAWLAMPGADFALASHPYEGGIEPTKAFHRLTQTVVDFGAQLVSIDSLHDVFAGNENSRLHARQFIRLLQELAQGIDGAVILTAHPSLSGLSSGSGMAGSTAWNNAVRSRLYFRRPKDDSDDDPEARELVRMKANYAPSGDFLKLEYQDGVFAPAYAPTGAVAAMDRRNCETVFLDLLKRAEREGRAVTDNKRAGNYAPKAFAARPRRVREGYDAIDFAKAMESLFADGRIRVEAYRSPDRHTRQKIVAAGGQI